MSETKTYYYLRGNNIFARDGEIGTPPLTSQQVQLGETWEDAQVNKYVLLSDQQAAFYEANPAASAKEVWNMELTPPPPPYEPTLEEAKKQKIAELMAYDSSPAVNGFYITRGGHTIETWLKPEERHSLNIMLNGARKMGMTEMPLSFKGIQITESIDNLDMMLTAIEMYAYQAVAYRDSVLVTAIESCQTNQEVYDYDFTIGWPAKPNF